MDKKEYFKHIYNLCKSEEDIKLEKEIAQTIKEVNNIALKFAKTKIELDKYKGLSQLLEENIKEILDYVLSTKHIPLINDNYSRSKNVSLESYEIAKFIKSTMESVKKFKNIHLIGE